MNRVHEQCPKIDLGTVLSQNWVKQVECTKCTACWPSLRAQVACLRCPVPCPCAHPVPCPCAACLRLCAPARAYAISCTHALCRVQCCMPLPTHPCGCLPCPTRPYGRLPRPLRPAGPIAQRPTPSQCSNGQ